jgi:hypothetical protein
MIIAYAALAHAARPLYVNPKGGFQREGVIRLSHSALRDQGQIVPGSMIRFLARVFRGLHAVMGITAPPPDHNERSFVFMWLGVIAFCIAFCGFLFYLMIHVF